MITNNRAQRTQLLLETSGLDVMPAETVATLAPQFQSPPENDLQNNVGFSKPTGKKYMEGGWIQQYSPQSTQLRNANQSPAGYVDQNTNTNPYSGSTVRDESLMTRAAHIRNLVEAAVMGPGAGQVLPYSNPSFAVPSPKAYVPRKSQATVYSNMVRRSQKERFLRKALSASWGKTPKAISPSLTPSQQSGHH